MSIRKTVQAGNKIIHTESVAVEDIHSEKVTEIVVDLIDTMRHTDLVGMAAPQIGENVRVFVTEIRETDYRKQEIDGLKVFINPELVSVSTEIVDDYEGCGSVAEAGLFGPVERAKQITVKALDEKGASFTLEAKDLLARIIQHEIDHLDGILFVEKISDRSKVMSRDEYKNMKIGHIG